MTFRESRRRVAFLGTLVCATSVLCVSAPSAFAQPAAVQFVRGWQPAAAASLAELRALAYGAEGSQLFVERDRGTLWHVKGDTATAAELSGRDRAFSSSKVGGVAFLGAGRIAVANTSNDTVAIVDERGTVARVFGGGGSGDGELKDPEGLAFSAHRRLYVADRGNNRVVVYSEDGVFLSAIGAERDAPSSLSRPLQVAVDNAERVYVLEDSGPGRLSVFSHAGKLLGRVGAEAFRGARAARWSALAADGSGRVYLADKANGNVVELDWSRKQIRRRFGSPGSGRGAFEEVVALAIAGNEIAVGDAGNRKIEYFRLPPSNVEAPEVEQLAGVRIAGSRELACERVYALDGGDLLCHERRGGKLKRLDATGKTKAEFDGQVERLRAAADDAREIAIADGDSIKVYSHDGKQRFAIGRGGSRDGEFDGIGGLHLADQLLYVADSGNRRVQIFTRDGIFVDKLADQGGAARRIARPTAVATDAFGAIYVADAETKTIQVYSAQREWVYQIGGAARPYETIHGIAVDRDNLLYVLAATENTKQAVDIYQGLARTFSFAAYRGPRGTPSAAATLSVDAAGGVISLHDAERKTIDTYQFLQMPARVGGLEARGEPGKVALAWRKAGEGYVTGYRVYGAAERGGSFERVLDVQRAEASLGADAVARYLHYRVSAITRFSVEGEWSASAEDLFGGAYRHYQAGRHEDAVAAFTRIARSGQDGAAIEFLGRSLLALARYDAALGQFQELGRIAGRETVGRRLEAQTLAASGDLLGARAAIERAIAANQVDTAGYVLCGDLSLQLGDAAGATRCLETALAREAGNVAARAMLGEAFVRLGAIDKGIAELDAAAAARPDEIAIWRRAARVLVGLGRHADALVRYARLLALAPRDTEALLATAEAHLALGEFDKARSIALSLAGGPEMESKGQLLLGRIALAENKNEDALLALTRATRLDARNGAAWAALGEAHLALKDERKARDALLKAVALPGAGAAMLRRLAEIEIRAGQADQALTLIERALALAPADVALRLAQARTLGVLGRWHESGKAAREGARLAPKDVEPLLLAGEAAHRQGKSGEAIDTFKRALALAPESYEVHLKLGRSYTENNLLNDAQSLLERAARIDERADAPHLLLGSVHAARRNFDDAIASLTRAVDLNPTEPNKRRLEEVYALRKEAQTGTGARVMLEDLRLTHLFAAAHKQYATERVGLVKLRNATAEDYKGLRVSFFIKEYMDYPVTREIAELKANSTQEIPLHATFNNKVLGIDEDTRVLAMVSLAMPDPRDAAQQITQALTLYGKNAIVWANGDMIGSFVTPREDTLRNFTREVVNRYAPPSKGALNRPLALAATVYNGLSALGLRYQPDPNTPYSRISADQVDYVQFPRETLRLKSGDCDDLSVLLAAAYENLGMETAMVEVPGHLFMMLRTGLKEADRGYISLQDELLVVRDGEIWLPIEATLIATSFTEAWAEGARRYKQAEDAKQLKVLSLRQAWERFPPAALAPAGFSVEIPAGERAKRLVERENRLLLARRLEREVLPYRQALETNPQDSEARLQIGIVHARNGVNDVAMREFDTIIEANPRHASAHNNRGNVHFARGDFERALDAYRYAEELDPGDGGIRVNAALAYYKLGKLAEARGKYREATQLRKELAAQYRAFAKLLSN